MRSAPLMFGFHFSQRWRLRYTLVVSVSVLFVCVLEIFLKIKAIIHSTKSSGSELIDAELWAKTKEEVDKGWLSGPHKDFPTAGRVSRRFAVVQSQKVRPVDNYSESQVNDAVTITNRCTVDGVDTIAAAGAVYLQGMLSRGDTDMLGRSFDLKSAYRQLAVSDDSLKWARLAVYDPHESATKLFQQFSLPFGAKASVIAFCHPVCQDDPVLSTQADDCCHLLLR